MADDLPEEFDLIVVGTGFAESCIAAAASRIGKTVLHLDSNEYYGGPWSSFNLKLFNDLILQNNTNVISKEIINGSSNWHIPAEDEEKKTEEIEEKSNTENLIDSATVSKNLTPDTEILTENWSQKKLLESSRHFSIDLVPRVVFSTGKLVKLLISSNICRYAEFRAVDRVCTMYQGHVLSVPCSRSDVFNTSDLNVVEKRLLMKFLNNCMSLGEAKSDDDAVEFRNRSFGEYLTAQNVTDKINTCVRQAIAMCRDDTDFTIGIERTQLFLRSLGQYGNTPFLFPQYGNGELPQCFCRLCAVFGGIYYLNHGIEQVQHDGATDKYVLHLDTGKCIRAQHVVMSPGSLPQQLNLPVGGGCGELVKSLSRGVFLSTTPLGDEELNSGGGGVLLLRLVTNDEEREAIFLQLARFTGTCPKGLYLLHLTTRAISDNPEADLQPFIQQIFTNEINTPKIIYSAFFTIMAQKQNSIMSTDILMPEQRVFCTAGPQYEIDYDLAIDNARSIFMNMYGKDVEFLPRAPDPEEIVIDGEDPSALNAHELPEDLRAQLLALEKNAAEMHVGESESQQEIDFLNTKSEAMDAE